MMKRRRRRRVLRNARLLLTGYWGYKMINGGDYPQDYSERPSDGPQAQMRGKTEESTESDHKSRKGPREQTASIAGSIFYGKSSKRSSEKHGSY